MYINMCDVLLHGQLDNRLSSYAYVVYVLWAESVIYMVLFYSHINSVQGRSVGFEVGEA